MPYIFRYSSQLKSIHFIYDQYKAGGYIDIFIRDVDSRPKLEAVIKLLSSAGITTEFNFYRPNSYGYYNFIRVKLTNCREAIDCLYKSELISVADRADIEAEIKKVEKCLVNRKKISSNITASQSDIIQSLFTDLYADEILDISPSNLNMVLTCLNIACSEYASWPNNDPWLGHALKHVTDKLEETDKKRLFDALRSIAKCYHGKANLESALEQSGSGIADIKLQREAILHSIKNKVLDKFPDLNNLSKFLTTLKLNTLALGYPIGNFYSQSDDIIDVLNHYLQIKCISHDVFVILIAHTLKEIDLSINDLPLCNKLKLSKLYKASWDILEKTGSIAKLLTKEDEALCRSIHVCLDEELSKNNHASAVRFFSERFDTYQKEYQIKRAVLFNELQNHQSHIRERCYLGKNGFLAKQNMQQKCATAAENRRGSALNISLPISRHHA